jgi:hypothetical protein
MLEQVRIENFKSWKTLDIKLGRVTGLFGANSSGKSSLLQFLLLLKQTRNATDRGLVLDFGGPGQLVNLGSYRDVVHGHDVDAKLKWEIKWSLFDRLQHIIKSRILLDRDMFGPIEVLREPFFVRSNAYFQNQKVVSDFLEYQFRDHKLSVVRPSGSLKFQLVGTGFPDYKLNRIDVELLSSWFSKTGEPNQNIMLSGPRKGYLLPSDSKTCYTGIACFDVFEIDYERMMDSIHYLGPLREYPRREYTWSGASPSEVGSRGERTMEAILSATLTDQSADSDNPSFQERIAHWLKELKLIHEFRVLEIAPGTNLFRALVRRDADSPETLLTEVGFGVSQILPALVQLHYVPEGSTVLMEQPEIHLHPSVQSGLADVIMSVAKARNLQVIVESHSEHLLRRFQRRVAEEAFPAEEIKLYFCENHGGESKLVDLRLDEFGEILNWPRDFFGDEMTEIAATRKAILKRKMEAAGT